MGNLLLFNSEKGGRSACRIVILGVDIIPEALRGGGGGGTPFLAPGPGGGKKWPFFGILESYFAADLKTFVSLNYRIIFVTEHEPR